MSNALNEEGLDLIFREARTHGVWLDKPVDDALLRRAYELAKMGPTSANMCPNPAKLLFPLSICIWTIGDSTNEKPGSRSQFMHASCERQGRDAVHRFIRLLSVTAGSRRFTRLLTVAAQILACASG